MTETLVDPDAIAELADTMGADFASELVETFLGDAPDMIAALKEALSAGDADGYRRAAHSIKSNAQTFGAGALADQAREMELTGLSAGAPAIPELEDIWHRTAAVLKGLPDG
ncbi:Hpt domain-containing protein [uncultured Roseobacter sp.]|uniref:Hpt domain-containing protein n=1 Tax=uncultured Roseobacter sp. TaxID=114847 RepID=UPI00260E68A0|nr:Hpt domain-containing protein [uncultured Roseobacter sp.]